MGGIRVFSIGAGVLSGLVLAGGLGYYSMCATGSCGKSDAQVIPLAATTEGATLAAAGLTDGDDEGCAKPCPKMGNATATAANVVAQPGATIGDATLCPVNGEIFTVTADSPTKVIDGVTYFVCCDSCTGEAHNDGTALAD